MKRIYISLFILLSGQLFTAVNAEDSCKNYPQPGFSIKDEENGEQKFLATAEVTVPIDDRDLYLDGMAEAKLEAKILIADFINENVGKSESFNNNSKRKVNIDGKNKSMNSEIVKERLRELTSRTPQTLLRGVRQLGSCYTPGSAVRVSVGWRLQDEQSADKLGNQMKRNNPWNFFNNKDNSSGGNNNSNNNSTVDFNPVGGYSDTSRFDNF